jgi:arylsulfatase A-like enzyme
MRAVVLMFDSLNRHMLPPYGGNAPAPNFTRLAERAVTFDRFYAGSMPCMPARREMHTGRYNFLHRSWGPLEPFDDSMPELLRRAGVHTHLASDHPHYWEDGGATYHTRYSTWEFFRGQEGDPWKGVVGPGAREAEPAMPVRVRRQDAVNRTYLTTEAEHYQTRTVDAGLHFLETNAGADDWLLQIELFDPHEPFFVPPERSDVNSGTELEWPPYRKVTEPPDQVESARAAYTRLLRMCDDSLGRVLDTMDAHDLWHDTMLIVNTDHGFLLGERGWWAKSVMPWFEELVHLPFFLWDPRTGERGTRCDALAQTIDLAPTLLRCFGLEPTPDMQGHDLAAMVGDERPVRVGALFGMHGSHVNVTDGRRVYLRAPAGANAPVEEFTLMPTHMRARFAVDELTDWEPAEPFAFTKGLRTMRMPASVLWWTDPGRHGTLLYDLAVDPGQEAPLDDPDVELRMLQLLADLMRASDAPASQFARLGIPTHDRPGPEHLLVAAQAAQARAAAEPLPPAVELPAADLLARPLRILLADERFRDVVQQYAPGTADTEILTIAPGLSLLELARTAFLPAAALRALALGLEAVVAQQPVGTVPATAPQP